MLTACLLAALGAGCVAVPFAAPPVRVSQAFGASVGRLVPRRLGGVVPSAPVEAISTTRVGVHPMQLVPALHLRRFDLGVGYGYETPLGEDARPLHRHVPYLEFTAFPHVAEVSDTVLFRAHATLLAELPVAAGQASSRLGWGGTFQAGIELAGFGAGAFASASVDDDEPTLAVGGAFGEWSVGLAAFASYRAVDGASHSVFGATLTLRLPLCAGVAIARWTPSRARSERGSVELRSPGGQDRADDGWRRRGAAEGGGGGTGRRGGRGEVEVRGRTGASDDDRGSVEVRGRSSGEVEVRSP